MALQATAAAAAIKTNFLVIQIVVNGYSRPSAGGILPRLQHAGGTNIFFT